MKLSQWLNQAEHSITSSSADLDSQLIASHVLGLSRAQLLANSTIDLTKSDVNKLNILLNRRINHEPLAYLFKQKEFYGLSLYVDNRVLIPRPESEVIVEWVIKNAPEKSKLLDVGTGSGALAIAIKTNRPDMIVSGVDVSEPALEVARKNARNFKADIKLSLSDLLQSVQQVSDIIVANLPYVPSEDELNHDAKHEPRVALLAQGKGLEYYLKLFKQLETKRFKDTTTVIVEANPDQFEQLHMRINHWDIQQLSDYVAVMRKKIRI